MGWAFVTYGDRYVHLHDMQIWALRHFLAAAASALAAEEPHPALFQQAREFFAAWDWPGPGVVTGTSLEKFVGGNSDRSSVLVRVCERAADRLQAFGEVVPLSCLEARVNVDSPGSVYTGEQPSAGFIRAVERIRGLLVPNAEPSGAAERGH
ncbi:MAG: hypothetical protein ACJ8C4_08475 [Gemmataceae bacterium]